MAIQSYQKAISTLIKLVRLYPDYKLNRHYMDKASIYQERVKPSSRPRAGAPGHPREGANFSIMGERNGNGNGARTPTERTARRSSQTGNGGRATGASDGAAAKGVLQRARGPREPT